MEFVQKEQNKNFLQSIDAFGIGINIKFNQNEKHKTRLGGFITLILYSLIIIFSINLIQQMTTKDKPLVLSEFKYVEQPQRYDLVPEKYTIVFSLLDKKNSPFIDPEIYQINAQFYLREEIVDDHGNKKYQQSTVDLQVVPCKKFHLNDKQTSDYFSTLDYQNMYCIESPSDLYLSGQFDAQIFSRLQITFNECNSKIQKCKSSNIVQQVLETTTVQIYFTNNILQVQDQKNPFKRVGQTQFWLTNIDTLQVASINFMNCNLKDDIGLFFEQIEHKRELVYYQDRVQYSKRVDKSFFQVRFNLQKSTELFYNRSYMKVPQAISQVGGIFNVLFALGCLLSYPYAKMQLHRQLINQTFSFERKLNNPKMGGQQQGEENLQQSGISKSSINNNKQGKLTSKDIISAMSDNKSPSSTNNNLNPAKLEGKEIEKIKLKDNNQQYKNEICIDEIFNNFTEKMKDQNGNLGKYKKGIKQIKKMFQEIKITTFDYILSYFSFFKCKQSQESQLLKYCIQKIYRYTDICYIVNKLIEFEKLKNLMLDTDQINLFEYIPKPKVNFELIKLEQQKLFQNNQSQIIDEIEANQQNYQLNLDQNINILSIENRPLTLKAKQAQRAFNKIQKKQHLQTEIDKKLIVMLDKRLRYLLESNKFQQNVEAQMLLNNIKLSQFAKKSTQPHKLSYSFNQSDNKNDEQPSTLYLNRNCSGSMIQKFILKSEDDNFEEDIGEEQANQQQLNSTQNFKILSSKLKQNQSFKQNQPKFQLSLNSSMINLKQENKNQEKIE